MYEWQSPKPICAATLRVKIFVISPICTTWALYCVGEQRTSWPGCAGVQPGLDHRCSHMFSGPFLQPPTHTWLVCSQASNDVCGRYVLWNMRVDAISLKDVQYLPTLALQQFTNFWRKLISVFDDGVFRYLHICRTKFSRITINLDCECYVTNCMYAY